MHLFPHRYEVNLASGADGYASLSTTGVPPLLTALPLQFDGPGDAWSPEHLLLASVQGCFVFMLRAVARRMNVTVNSLDVTAVGTVHRLAGVARFGEIVLRPTISVDASVSDEVVTELLDTAAKASLISASLSAPVHLEPVIVHADAPRGLVSHAA